MPVPMFRGVESDEALKRGARELDEWDVPGSRVGTHTARRVLRQADIALMTTDFTPKPSLDDRFVTISHAANAAGYVLFDAGENDAAKEAFMVAFNAAGMITDERGDSLKHRSRASRARLTVHELRTIRRYPTDHVRNQIPAPISSLTAKEKALNCRVAARALSNLGDATEAQRLIHQADQWWACGGYVPEWLGPDSIAEHYGDTGHSFADIAMHSDMTMQARINMVAVAMERLILASEHRSAHERTRVFSLLAMAELQCRWGDRDHAYELARRALPLRERVHSAQADDMMRRLAHAAAAADMGDLVEEIDA